MAKGKISKQAVDALGAEERDVYLWDRQLAGFGLKVTPTGSKVYLVQYRIGGRRSPTRRVTIGKHGSLWTDPTTGQVKSLTPDAARTEAKRVLGLVAAGHDPAEEKSQARRDLIISELCDLYLGEGCPTQKASTLVSDRGRIERHIKPLLGRKRVNAVSRADVQRFMQDVASGKTAMDQKTGPRGRSIVRGGKGVANRTLAVLSAIFSFAVGREVRPDNPALRVKRFPSQKKERFLSPAELSRLGDALLAAEQTGANPSAVNAIRLLALTGCRKAEILGLQWNYIDWEHSCLRLPDSKSGARVVPLGAAPLEILSSLPRLAGNPHVLPSNKSDGHFVGLQKFWERIRDEARLSGVRLHDLRHGFASVAVSGDSLFLVGKILGHRHARTTE
jgi:site-specific recombinase XerD